MVLKRCSGVFVFAVLAVAGRAIAEDRDLDFLHALQAHNYGDTAAEFLQAAKDTPNVKDVWDLEMSKSLRIEAMTASDAAVKESLLKQAQTYLDKFAQDKPNHPEALQAKLANAGMVMDQGAEALVVARLLKDPAEKKVKLVEARKYFEQAQPMLESAVKSLRERLAKVGPLPRVQNPNKADRDKLAEHNTVEENLIQARGRLSLIDYYIAQTYTAKDEDGKRRQALNKAAAALDEIYQEYRGDDPNLPTGRFAIAAHSWTGKVDEELGGFDDAKAIYDEVLENFQDLKESKTSVFPMEAGLKGPYALRYQKTEIDDILARTKHFALLLLARRASQQKEYLAEARDFVETEEYKKNLKNEWGYQAAAFELAKHLAAAAEKESKPAEKTKLTREALKIIGELAAMRGEFQREAIELRKSLGSGTDNVATVDEAIQLADISIDEKQWDDATKWLKRAQEIEEAKPKKDAAVISTIQERLATIAMQPISTAFEEAKKKGEFTKAEWSAWLEGVNQVVRDFKKTLVAQKAMGFAIDCAEQLHRIAVDAEKEALAKNDKSAKQAAAAERIAALKRLKETAGLAQSLYPGSSEADKGRIALARIDAIDGKYSEALEVFESINRNSDKYAEALDMAGRIRYTRFLLERNKPEKERNAKQMEEDRLKAVDHFTESTTAAKRALKPGDPFPEGLLKTYVVLAQIRLDAKEFKEARDAAEPIVAVLSDAAKNGPIQLDKNMLDLFGAAVRADVGLNDFQKAGEHGRLLLEIGPDEPQINAVLVNFVQRLDIERKAIQDTLNSLPDSTPPAEAERIRNNLASVKEMLADMLKKLASRQKMTPPTLVYIGNLFDAIDMPNEAEQQYRSVLDRAKDDPEFTKDKENSRLLNAVRAKQVSILRKRGKYQEAVDVATNLITLFPDALEPLVERARIYQDWAKSGRDPSKFDDAIASWTEIRRRLDKTMARPEPKRQAERDRYRGLQASYFEAIYNVADCLLAQAKRLQTTDKSAAAQKAKLGEQLLTAVLMSHPKLDGTEATMKKFAAIKSQLAAFRTATANAAPASGPAGQ